MIKKQKIGSCNTTCGGYKLQNWRTEELKIYLGKSRWTKYEISYWDPKFVVTEVWPPSQYLWLHCTFTRILLSSVIDTAHISLSCKTHQNLQPIKIWRFQSNLNGVSPISDNRKRIIFLISLTWLTNLTGIFDCLKNSNQVKSPNHCLQIIVEKSDKILQASKQVKESALSAKNLSHHTSWDRSH